jgi:hypothetical protein
MLAMSRIGRASRASAISIVALVVAFSVSAGASAATTTYEGSFTGALGSELSFDVVKKRSKGKVRRTVQNFEFTGMPIFCQETGEGTSQGRLQVRARVSRDDRFAGTSYRESPGGFINSSHLRGEFRQNRRLAAGVLVHTFRASGKPGFFDCSTGFLEWAANKVP